MFLTCLSRMCSTQMMLILGTMELKLVARGMLKQLGLLIRKAGGLMRAMLVLMAPRVGIREL